jgi:hypothetical protein
MPSTLEPQEKILNSPAAPPIPLRSLRLYERAGDRLFRYAMLAFAGMVVAIAAGIFVKPTTTTTNAL